MRAILVSLLSIVALIALFLKLPEVLLVSCKSCISADPYLPLLGAGYFSALLALSLLCSRCITPLVARAGLVWALLLAIALTYSDYPNICVLCLVAHACNIMIWLVLLKMKAVKSVVTVERVVLLFIIPIAVVSLFASLNLTFMVYGMNKSEQLKPGDAVAFSFQKEHDTRRVVVSFTAKDCPYCTELFPILEEASSQMEQALRFINISPYTWRNSLTIESIEDSDGVLRKEFKVIGYPTLFFIESDGTIIKIIRGVPSGLQEEFKSLS